MLSCVLRPQWIIACQAFLPVGFPRQEYWSGMPFPPSSNLLYPGIEPASLASPALAGGFFTTSATWEAPSITVYGAYGYLLVPVPFVEKTPFSAKLPL